MERIKKGTVRDDGMVCWSAGWKKASGETSYYWVTREKFDEMMARQKQNLARYCAQNAEKLKAYQREKYLLNAEAYKQRNKARYAVKKDEILAKNKEWRVNNREKERQNKKLYRALNRERVRRWNRKYERNNREKLREKNRNDRRTNPMRRLKDALRGSVRAYIGSKKTRGSSTFQIIGCTPDELRKHLESKFRDGMTWDNYGSYWEVDHIMPLASAKDFAGLFRLSHWTNLQPLTCEENRAKSDRVDGLFV
jgi:hypothetical protein